MPDRRMETFAGPGLPPDGASIKRNTIPDYWTSELWALIELGRSAERDGYPFGPWGQNPAMVVDAVRLYRAVMGAQNANA